ncbi:ABC transporter ATP-binding protein [Croceicoccus sp. F390]|uniref:ABC transporter ATP-binding protein n=1 Tax=Croceicoccus esteveae TaxID=3075597 RepID=A0ABU2ZKA2_9SPHN|nr:ABC transporter ATP-binding protein [Croceicoccus sp. F390]MDT0577033.1 ABC transporter ATP-binding protein [Croceicoccus sp. F390]
MIGTTRAFASFLLELTRGRIAIALALMILVGLTEGLSLVILIPLLAAVDPGGAAEMGRLPLIGDWLGTLTLSLPLLLVGFVLLIAVQAMLARAKSLYLARTMHRAIDQLRLQLFESVGMARWEVTARTRPADINHVLLGEIDRVRSAASSLLALMQTMVMLLIYIALAALVAWEMALFASLVGSLLFFLLYPVRRKATRFGHDLSRMFQEQNVTLLEFLTGIRVAKSFVIEEEYAGRLRRHLDVVRQKTIGFASISTLGTLFFQVASAAFAAIFVYVAAAVFTLGLPRIAVLLLIFVRVAPRFSGLQDSLQQYFTALPAFDNVMQQIGFYTREAETLPAPGVTAPTMQSAIRFENVVLQFDGAAAPLLGGICLDVPAGEVTALIGPSGSGKSTIADLAMGLLRPTGGRIFIDDTPLDDGNRRLWRKSVGFVPQDPFLLNDTLAVNLRIADPQATQGDIERALTLANAMGFVAALPDGLDTVVGERGTRFSGGERQRIALARALLRQPAFLILDEATSALDWENQEAIAAAIKRLRGQLTILTIAHRPSMMDFADHVIALQDGRIVEQGKFGSLARDPHSHLARLLASEQRERS